MNETIEQLKPLMTEVANKVGQTAEWGWEIVVRQQIAYGIVAIFVALMGLVGLYLIYRYSKRGEFDFSEPEYFVPTAMCSILFGGLFIGGTINAILLLSNPEFYAIQFFINLVK